MPKYSESYVTPCLTGWWKSLVEQLRAVFVPLAIEVGTLKIYSERKQFFDLGEVESEAHFLLYCTYYDYLRVPVFY